jgi:hypothetical protein
MTASHLETNPILGDREVRLTELGFVPGLPVYEVQNLTPPEGEPAATPITVDMLKRALFESSYSQPLVVPLLHHDRGPVDLDQPLPMVVELAQAIYEPMRERRDSRAVGCWEYPSWYLRGYLHKSPFDASAETIRMHVFLNTEAGTKTINEYFVQLVPEPTTTCDDAPLLCGGKVLPASE